MTPREVFVRVWRGTRNMYGIRLRHVRKGVTVDSLRDSLAALRGAKGSQAVHRAERQEMAGREVSHA